MQFIENRELIDIKDAAKRLGIKPDIIRYHIEEGKIEDFDGKIKKSVCDLIKKQKNEYIGIKSFLQQHDNERFISKYSQNRQKFIDEFEKNFRYNISIIDPSEVLFDYPGREEFYFLKEDAQYLEYRSEQFFRDFGLSDEEKVKRLLESEKNHRKSQTYLKSYMDYLGVDKNIYTPSFTEFVKLVLDLPDITSITNETALTVYKEAEGKRVKELFRQFLRYVKNFEQVMYGDISPKKMENVSLANTAYTYVEFVKIAIALFNVNYDKAHKLTEKALENHLFAEMWLYLSCHYVCAWRSADICNNWVYLDLKSNDNVFGIKKDTLKEDIINGKITDETYAKVALYAIRKIEMANNTPAKTGNGKLRAEITPELRIFFGKLILIAEYHHITSGEGYMMATRTWRYKNWVECKEFFGDEMFELTGFHNLSSTRLNKSYLQGLEKTARENSETTIVAHMIASLARNHSDIDTTAIYIRDHGLTGENAETVLYMLFERRVFGDALYNALIAAYPDSFKKLPAKIQTEIISKIPISAFDLESIAPSFRAGEEIKDSLAKGDKEEPLRILKEMFAIGQGKGRAKDKGVFCKKRALGLECVHPKYESCIANLCPYHVFTAEGLPSLIKVVEDYYNKYLKTGNVKYRLILDNKIKPAFQDIIKALLKEMSEEEKNSIKLMLKEGLDDAQSAKQN